MKVLLAEDDPFAVMFLRQTLLRLGHGPLVASNGVEAGSLLSSGDTRPSSQPAWPSGTTT